MKIARNQSLDSDEVEGKTENNKREFECSELSS
jgi:hypothetical protein